MRDIIDSTNSRLDNLSRELQDNKTSLQLTQKEVQDIKKDSVKQADATQPRTIYTKQSIQYILWNTKMEYLEDQSRYKNLIIDGIAESPGETWAKEEVEEKLRKVFNDRLQIRQEIEMKRAHCTGKPGSGRPWPIVVRLSKYRDKLTKRNKDFHKR